MRARAGQSRGRMDATDHRRDVRSPLYASTMRNRMRPESSAVEKRFDLNLLQIAVVLYEERNVSKAATRLGLSQPAISSALKRLRGMVNDPLFVRTPRGMDPTPRMEALVSPARDILLRIDRDVLSGREFVPELTTATFTFALSDVGEMVFLPRILERLREAAPLAAIRSVSPPPDELRRRLENGDVDLAIGYFPDLESGNFFQQRLFTHHFSCLLRADHPLAGKKLTLRQFLELEHVSVRAEGRSQELLERYFVSKKISRNIVLFTPHFMSLPMIIARSDLAATVPHAIGMYYARPLANIKAMSLPSLDLPKIVLKQHWHRKFHKDSRNQWLRKLMSELFSQELDEWRGSER
jgi:DNA-binding transcriptional LysR family regulator